MIICFKNKFLNSISISWYLLVILSILCYTNVQNILRESVQIRSFFRSLFSRIPTKYGEIRSIFPYSVQMQEITDQEKPRIWTLFTLWQLLDYSHIPVVMHTLYNGISTPCSNYPYHLLTIFNYPLYYVV